MPAVGTAEGDVAGLPAFWREAEPLTAVPVLYLHGVPVNSDIWVPFLERTGGLAPDLPGFGRSGKPASFDYSIPGYTRWLEAFLEARGIDRFCLAVHDWGGALGLAMRPEVLARVERLVSLGHVPVGVEGFRWHRLARRWRTPVVGELAMGFSSRWLTARALRAGRGGPMPDEFVDSIWDHFDQGTQRAILKLYRSAPPDVLAAASDLGRLTCAALLLWSANDPYLTPGTFGPATAQALGGPVEFELVDAPGHWWWVDDPSLLERPVAFLLGEVLPSN
jgi:pimeloyl-ACP methyl ester carboxylesterase